MTGIRVFEDEAYGTYEAAWRETYGRAARAPKPRRKPVVRESYRVTADTRVLCSCGVFVYTEQIDGRPPALPASCWRCLQPLDSTVMPPGRQGEAVEAAREREG